jgi:hypothetical protein
MHKYQKKNRQESRDIAERIIMERNEKHSLLTVTWRVSSRGKNYRIGEYPK